ncbi:MAG: hypothetical protein J6113_04870 [Lachnospiraceae bacterium]|nr:hypothetical protein [Lachnospiraceae bacterium]
MSKLNKIERKIGKYAIPHLMRYVLALYIIGMIVDMVNPAIYTSFLMLDIDKLLQGQVWRIVTFLIQPPDVSLLFLVFFLYLYYMIGEALEAAWGSFFFNLYFFAGVLFNILVVVGFYVATRVITGTGQSPMISVSYINQSLFLAFAALYPNTQLLLFFFIPVKIKWIGIADGILMGYGVIRNVILGFRAINFVDRVDNFAKAIAVVVAMANFLIFFIMFKTKRFIPMGMARQRAQFRRNMERAQREYGRAEGFTTIAKHKCAICGRTEHDGDDIEFRYCSRCVGNYEYCLEHLYTHTHVGYMANPEDVTGGTKDE